MIYLDGSALCRFLPGVRHGEAWREWVEAHRGEVVTSQLSLTELRQAAALYPRESLDDVTAVVDEVREMIPQIRFSDDNVTISSHATAVLKPFAALHIGAAAGDDTVDTIATYDPSLAHVAEIYRLKVVTPGLNPKWYLDFEGPVEGWTPVALDAPYDPGAEYALAPIERRPDAFEKALMDEQFDVRTPETQDPKEETAVPGPFTPGLGGDEAIGDEAPAWELTDEGELVSTEPKLAIIHAGIEEPTSRVTATEPSKAPPTPSPEEKIPSEESEASRRRAELIARLGAYTPKVEAWHAPEGSEVPEFALATPPATPGSFDETLSQQPVNVPIELSEQPSFAEPEFVVAEPEFVTVEPEVALPEQSYTHPDEIAAAPKPTEASSSHIGPTGPIGEPVFRPMMEQAALESAQRETAAPSIEMGGPLTVPLPLHVEFDDRSSYAPDRIETSGARPLPGSHPFARSGQTEAMDAPAPHAIPALEPLAPETLPPRTLPQPFSVPPPSAMGETLPSQLAPSAGEEKSSRWRRGKAKEEKKKGKESSGSPEATPDGEATWRLDDVIGSGDGGKG